MRRMPTPAHKKALSLFPLGRSTRSECWRICSPESTKITFLLCASPAKFALCLRFGPAGAMSQFHNFGCTFETPELQVDSTGNRNSTTFLQTEIVRSLAASRTQAAGYKKQLSQRLIYHLERRWASSGFSEPAFSSFTAFPEALKAKP